MYYCYVLQSIKNSKLYIGYTGDLRKRFRDHNSCNGGVYTSKNAPFRLIFYEAYLNKVDAMTAERFFKTGYGREVLRGKISNYLKK